MRFLILVILLVLLVGAGLGTLINVDPGYVLLAWGDTSIEMSIWVLMLGIVLVYIAMSLSLRFVIALNLPFRVLGNWQETSRIKRMQLQTRHGLLALADGQNMRAEKKFAELAPTTSQPIVVLPALATAMGRQGKIDEAGQVLNKLVSEFPGTQQLVHLKLAEISLYQGNDEKALNALRSLHLLNPQHAEANQLLLDLLQRQQMWPELISLLLVVGSCNQLSEDQLAQQQQLAYGRAFSASHRQDGSAVKSSLDQLQALWSKAPKSITNHGPSIISYAKAMARIEGDSASKTEAFIEQALKLLWLDELVLEYAHLPLTDLQKSLTKAEAWQANAKDSAALQLTLGRLCRRLELWGKAQDYLQASITLQASKEAHAEMARLQHKMGHVDVAIEHYRLASVF
ncbi:heme biosynthesis HemY N-terminal domain-containing protein [Candidatus Njordibacter sp. Uisw_039]|jgi:HemY protein|uniref:heme biosynthesis HemY N-terminal domain-containing protein n=1 Tax=Candidatus Njordibacter sp. Uisw_039 TaxID=3230972 RepID=UPI003A49AC63|tara:strand:+ start:6192 stop:7391 length:1200 start_codon:yes stop_codon:yes gene_type:complete